LAGIGVGAGAGVAAGVAVAVTPDWAVDCAEAFVRMTISTRRLAARPWGVPSEATGWYSPYPVLP